MAAHVSTSLCDARLPCFNGITVEPCTPRSLIPAPDLTPHIEAVRGLAFHGTPVRMACDAFAMPSATLNPRASAFMPPEPMPSETALNASAPEFKPSHEMSRPSSPKLNRDAPVFKPSRPSSPIAFEISSEKPLARALAAMAPPITSILPPPPPPPPLFAKMHEQLQQLVAGKSSSDQRAASLLKELESCISREAALVTRQKELTERVEAAAIEVNTANVSLNLARMEMENLKSARAQERKAHAEGLVTLRDSNEELLSKTEVLQHQLHLLRRELNLERNRATETVPSDGLAALLEQRPLLVPFPVFLPVHPPLLTPLMMAAQPNQMAAACVPAVLQPRRAVSVVDARAPVALARKAIQKAATQKANSAKGTPSTTLGKSGRR